MTRPNVLLVVVDAQVDFVMSDGLLPVPGAEAIVVPGIRYLVGLDPAEIAGVLFTSDTHVRGAYIGSPENLGDPVAGVPGFPLHCELGTPGHANAFNPALIPAAIPVHHLRKGVFDMWAEPPSRDLHRDATGIVVHDRGDPMTERDEWLGGTTRTDAGEPVHQPGSIRHEGVDTVRIVGVAADYCVKWAIAGFLERGYRVEVVAGLTAGIQRDIEQTVVDEFAGRVLVV